VDRRWSTHRSGQGQRILIVDDDESLLNLASENRRLLGYAPVTFTSGIRP
jgi:hypothetical protein